MNRGSSGNSTPVHPPVSCAVAVDAVPVSGTPCLWRVRQQSVKRPPFLHTVVNMADYRITHSRKDGADADRRLDGFLINGGYHPIDQVISWIIKGGASVLGGRARAIGVG